MATPGQDTGYAWVMLACSVLMLSIPAFNTLTYGVFSTELRSTFGWSEAELGEIAALRLGFLSIAGVIGGPLCDMFGFRPICIFGICLSAAGHIIASFSSDKFVIFITFGLFSGLGAGITITPAYVIVQRVFVRYRALAGGLSAAGQGVFAVIASPLSSLLVYAYGWRGAMLLVGAISIQMIPPACIFGLKPPNPGQDNDCHELKDINDSEHDLKKTGFKRHLTRFYRYYFDKGLLDRTFVLFVITMCTRVALEDTYYIRLAPFGLHIGLTPVQAAFLPSGVAISGTVGRGLSGILARPTSPTYLYVFMSLAAGLVVLCVPFVPHTFPAQMAVGTLYGFLIGNQVGIQITCMADLIGLEKLPLGISWLNIFVTVVRIIVNIFVGWLLERTGSFDIVHWSIASLHIAGSLCSVYLLWYKYNMK